ncbi:MAG: SPOR domain-containing protein [Fibrobacterota bacterium]|nr:SPOR domain-containing protein [Fibrobacterota bacterium]
MKTLTPRLSAAAIAAFLMATIFFSTGSVHASLAEHPDPVKLQPAPLPKSVPKQAQVPTMTPSNGPELSLRPAPAQQSPAPVTPAKPAQSKPEKPAFAARTVSVRDEIMSLARKGYLDSAHALARAALETDPTNPFLLLMLGKLSPGGKESSEYFKKAINSSPASPEAEESHFRLGQFHYAAGKYHLAIPNFRDYLRLFPGGNWKEPAHYWMGNACLALAKSRPDRTNYLDTGAVWFQNLLNQSTPDDYYYPLALEGLAKAKAAKGDREGAWQAARTALDKAPEEVRGPLLLLAAQLRQGVNRNEEKGMMARLVGQYPQSPEARYLRKLNLGVDTSRWKSGSSLPRPAVPPAKDSLAFALPKGPDTAKDATVTQTLPTAVKPGEMGFTLQLGAFSQASNADAMMTNLAKLGFTAELVESNRGGKRIFQVRLGRFATPDEASEYARLNLKPRRFLSQPVPLSP